MTLEAGAGIAAGLFFEIDDGVVALMWGAALVHEATAVWDVGYTLARRPVSQAEDHTHSFLEVLPFVAAAFAAFVHRASTRAGTDRGARRFGFRLNRRPPPRPTVVAVAASGLLGVAPYVEELVRCWRVKPTIAPQPLPNGHGPPPAK